MLTGPGVHEQARMQACGQPHASTYTQANKNTRKHAPGDGSSRARLPPVLSQLMVTWVTQLQARPDTWLEKDEESGEMERGRDDREEWIERKR